MAKLLTWMLLLVALQLGIIIFYNPMSGVGSAAIPCTVDTNCSSVGGACVDGYCEGAPSTIWTFLLGISNNNTDTEWFKYLFGMSLGVILVGAVAGTFVGIRITDFILFAGLVGTVLLFVSIFGVFSAIMRNELVGRFGSLTGCSFASCPLIDYTIAVTVAVFAFMYVWTVLDWWRLKD